MINYRTIIIVTSLAASWGGHVRAADVDFRRDIRPILSDKCYACHGPDAQQRQADLRLDQFHSATADLGGYAAVVPGEPDSSALIERIVSEDADERMPPADHPKQLTASEIKLLRDWVAGGAAWDEHWAYVQPQRAGVSAELQSGTSSPWSRNVIDDFVLAKLQPLHIEPSPQADPRTLLRRLHFDLLGLPPTTKEVERVLADESPLAYEGLVDRLLQSPHFGERLAVYWLDLVRYADTVGYHGDQDVSVSPYRDYVIAAFNKNKPFDQFTREQLAGDLLENPTPEQLVASGYNKLGMMSAEGGVQPDEYLVKYAADRVRTASTVWLGSTLGCAECHDHKFDPFTTQDFYRFAAFFADIKERGLYAGANRDGAWGPSLEVKHVGLEKLLYPLDQQIARVEAEINAPDAELDAAQQAWEELQVAGLETWRTILPTALESTGGAKLKIGEAGEVLVSGDSPNKATYTLTFEPAQLAALEGGTISAICIEALSDEKLPGGGPGRAGNGNFVVTEVRAWLSQADGTPKPLEFASAYASSEQADMSKENPYGKWPAAATIDNNQQTDNWGWAILPQVGQRSQLVVKLAEPIHCQKQELKIAIEQNHGNPKHTLGRFRIRVAAGPVEDGLLPNDLGSGLQEALLVEDEMRTAEQKQLLFEHFRATAEALSGQRELLKQLVAKRAKVVADNTRTTLITVAVEPRQMRVLHRGDWMDKTGEVVQPGVPKFLGSVGLTSDAPPTRLELANWLCSPENPLTARVFVNRLWTLLFGAGLASSLDDFGSQGTPPEYAELLDALAIEFIDSGWDIKHMVRLMVTSSTYRQSSLPRAELAERDPYNRLLARQSRYRLDAEFVRDNALSVSGLLVSHLGGRSAKPYQPAGLYQHLNFPARTYQADTDVNQYRRGVYTHWQRQFLHPALQAMDAPAREECTAQRPRSNTPLAALVLLNDPSYVEAARNLAERAMVAKTTTVGRLQWIGNRVVTRNFNEVELGVLVGLLENQLQHYRDDVDSAKRLVEVGLSPAATDIPPAELAAWTNVARSVLNMHEVITRN